MIPNTSFVDALLARLVRSWVWENEFVKLTSLFSAMHAASLQARVKQMEGAE